MQVLLLHNRLAEELELRAVLESALEHASGPLTNFPRHLPISVRLELKHLQILSSVLYSSLVLFKPLFYVLSLLLSS
jgi:hypothetical protein